MYRIYCIYIFCKFITNLKAATLQCLRTSYSILLEVQVLVRQQIVDDTKKQ